MGDAKEEKPDSRCLASAATGQHGFFTTVQARACGYSPKLLSYHNRTGRFVRVHRGVYRLRDYPSTPHDELIAAWLAVGKDSAVVSHESALDLLDLSDVIPNALHFTVPRSRRNLPTLPWVAIHTTTRPLLPADITTREGIKLTSPTRTILDAAETGTGPEQIEMAVRQAVRRALFTSQQLREAAADRSARVRSLVIGALESPPQ